jgi:hypothetical protein
LGCSQCIGKKDFISNLLGYGLIIGCNFCKQLAQVKMTKY